MTDPDLDLLRHALLRSTEIGVPSPACLDDDTIAALAEGALDATARAAAVSHLATCPRCRGAVASVARALREAAVAAEAARLQGATGRRFWRVGLPLAAAAVLLLLAWPPKPEESGPPHRAPPIEGVVPLPVSPVGAVADAENLRWMRVPGADRYRVTLFDVAGRVLYETQLGDTVAVLPDSVGLVPGQVYVWKIEARTGFDRWAGSALVEFSIAGGAPR